MLEGKAKLQFQQAGILFKAEKYADALTKLDELNQKHPNDPEILLARAGCLAKLGKTREAAMLCDHVARALGDPRGSSYKKKLGLEQDDDWILDAGVPPTKTASIAVQDTTTRGALKHKASVTHNSNKTIAWLFASHLRYGSVILAICALALGYILTFPGSKPSTRTVVFPAGEPLGSLEISDTLEDGDYLAEARGPVNVPRSKNLIYKVYEHKIRGIPHHDEIQPDDIQRLDIVGKDVTDEHLQGIGQLSGLKALDIHNSRITDSGLSYLTTLTQLERLNLQGTPVTDVGIAQLSTLHRLAYINVKDTSVTPDGVSTLQKTLSSCLIEDSFSDKAMQKVAEYAPPEEDHSEELNATGIRVLVPDFLPFKNAMPNQENWEPQTTAFGDGTLALAANAEADGDASGSTERAVVAFITKDNKIVETDGFYTDAGNPWTSNNDSVRTNGNIPRIAGDLRPGGTKYLLGNECTPWAFPDLFPSYGSGFEYDAQTGSVQLFEKTATGSTPLSHVFDPIFGKWTTNGSNGAQTGRFGGDICCLSNGNFVVVQEDRTTLLHPAGESIAPIMTIVSALSGKVIVGPSYAVQTKPKDPHWTWCNLAAFNGGFALRPQNKNDYEGSTSIQFWDNEGRPLGTSGFKVRTDPAISLPPANGFATSISKRGSFEARIASNIQSDFVYYAGCGVDSNGNPEGGVYVTKINAHTRQTVREAYVSSGRTIEPDRVVVCCDHRDIVFVCWSDQSYTGNKQILGRFYDSELEPVTDIFLVFQKSEPGPTAVTNFSVRRPSCSIVDGRVLITASVDQDAPILGLTQHDQIAIVIAVPGQSSHRSPPPLDSDPDTNVGLQGEPIRQGAIASTGAGERGSEEADTLPGRVGGDRTKPNGPKEETEDPLELGKKYLWGVGVEKDLVKAEALFKRSFDGGHTEATGFLGQVAKEKGDFEAAVDWYRQGSESGDAGSMDALAQMYLLGEGVEKNPQEAVSWAVKGYEAGEGCSSFLQTFYLCGLHSTTLDFDPTPIVERAQTARNYTAKALLGRLYELGHGVPEDLEKARQMYEEASKGEDPWAMVLLGLMYKDGHGVAKDDRRAAEFFARAAERDDQWAMGQLALMYFEGRGVDRDEEKAVEWLGRGSGSLAFPPGISSFCCRILGDLYREGRGVPQDPAKAAEYYGLAAKGGYGSVRVRLVNEDGQPGECVYPAGAGLLNEDAVLAMYRLGEMYERGEGVEKDSDAALGWYQKAAERGNEDAKKALERLGAATTGIDQGAAGKATRNDSLEEQTRQDLINSGGPVIPPASIPIETGKVPKDAVSVFLPAGEIIDSTGDLAGSGVFLTVTQVEFAGQEKEGRRIEIKATPTGEFVIGVTAQFQASAGTNLFAQLDDLPAIQKVLLHRRGGTDEINQTVRFSSDTRSGYPAINGNGKMSFTLKSWAPKESGRYKKWLDIGLTGNGLLKKRIFFTLAVEPSDELATPSPEDERSLEYPAAESLSTPLEQLPVLTVEIPGLPEGARILRLVRIPAGSFQMGSEPHEGRHSEAEAPIHTVTIAQDFYMGETEVTQAQWEVVMGANPSDFKEGEDYPVERVSYHHAIEFTKKISLLCDGSFRLSTEAEWEYACRAGTTTPYFFGEDPAAFGEYAVNDDKPHAVGTKRPNPWGLYDMYGNVWEWCEDKFDPSFYSSPAATQPSPVLRGTHHDRRVVRGGMWGMGAWCRSGMRSGLLPSETGGIGLRLVGEVEKPEDKDNSPIAARSEPARQQSNVLKLRLWLSGKSTLFIRGDTLWFKHITGYRPGELGSHDSCPNPPVVNGKECSLRWRGVPRLRPSIDPGLRFAS